MCSECYTKCCVCVPLKTGAFILGYMLMTVNAIELFITVINLSVLNMSVNSSHGNEQGAGIVKYLGYAVAFAYACQMIMSINLLVGLHQKQQVPVKKFSGVYPVLMLIYYLIFFLVLFINAERYNQTEWVLNLVDLVILIFQVYAVFIVAQYTRRDEMNRQDIPRSDSAAGNIVSYHNNTLNVINECETLKCED